ncbi:MAG: TIGR02594 family protein [Hyphomicrobium sp.]
MDQPAWLAAAWADFGVREKAGVSNEARVVGYFAEAGHPEIKGDAAPWCAAFVGAMLARSGFKHTGSLMARSYMRWGAPLNEPKFGGIAVLSRGSDPFAGHVGFLVGSAAGRIFLLGGNQGDAVSVEAFDAERVLGYRWPHDDADDITPEPVATSSFTRALAHVLEMEGGFSDDPYDPGGPTNKGITLGDFAKWRGETVTALSRATLIAALKEIPDAAVSAIYRTRYWQPASCADLGDGVALMHFDAAVNHGIGGAIRLLQAALGVTADGEIGPQTLSAARTQPAHAIIERYAELRRARYRALPHFWRFGRGWLRRVDATEKLAFDLAGEAQLTIETAKGTTTMNQDFKFPLPGEIPGQTMPGQIPDKPDGKWWVESKTVWGTLITALATVLPVIGPLIGLNLPADVIRQFGDQAIVVVQALAGLFGTILTIYGRAQASAPLVRRDVSVRM